MNIWTEVFVPYILPALGVLLSGLLTWLTTVIVNWLNEKVKNDKIKKLILSISDAVNNAVQATYQTYVENIKGTEGWTKEAQEEALRRALAAAKKALTDEAIKYIEGLYGDLDAYLTLLIESILYNLKNGKTTTNNVTIEK